ncbi:MAG: hypothetical protein GX988_03780 [Clostridiales bacterium]|nr:hypothetical protein [Clostridiales bacterium]
MSKRKLNSAAALKYSAEENHAPVVVASGHGELASRIVSVAEENGIPVYRDDSAATLLTMLQVGSEIPPQLYQVIASIYAEVLKTSSKITEKEKD